MSNWEFGVAITPARGGLYDPAPVLYLLPPVQRGIACHSMGNNHRLHHLAGNFRSFGMVRYLKMFAVLSLLGSGSCLMGCKALSEHNTIREISWGTSLKLGTTTTQGPDVVATDELRVPSLAESVFGSPESEVVEETPEP